MKINFKDSRVRAILTSIVPAIFAFKYYLNGNKTIGLVLGILSAIVIIPSLFFLLKDRKNMK